MQSESCKNITQKEYFLKYLEKMDIEMLDIVLDNSITYFGASKIVFLEKLSYLFNQARLSGENYYVKIKKHKKQLNTYYLYFPNLCCATKFIIEEKEGTISKIYSPKIKTSKEEIEMLGVGEIFFGNDEKVGFIPSNEYVMNTYRCRKAYEELENEKPIILTTSDISMWINKHELLYEEIKEDYLLFKFNDFRNLYEWLQYLLEALLHYDEVKEALQAFSNSNTNELCQWLTEYYMLGCCKVNGFYSNFMDIDIVNKTSKLMCCKNIYFKGDDFLEIIKFERLYFDNFIKFHHEMEAKNKTID